MARITPGRYTANIDGDFVVFHIGMRINKFWKVHKWLPVARAMGPMLRALSEHPEKGLLGFRVLPGLRNVTVIQYWRSFEQLEQFARDTTDPHFESWRRFNAKVGTDGDVGIWHETYKVAANSYECIYNNMPRIGLAAASEHVPVARRGERASERLHVGSVRG